MNLNSFWHADRTSSDFLHFHLYHRTYSKCCNSNLCLCLNWTRIGRLSYRRCRPLFKFAKDFAELKYHLRKLVAISLFLFLRLHQLLEFGWQTNALNTWIFNCSLLKPLKQFFRVIKSDFNSNLKLVEITTKHYFVCFSPLFYLKILSYHFSQPFINFTVWHLSNSNLPVYMLPYFDCWINYFSCFVHCSDQPFVRSFNVMQ